MAFCWGLPNDFLDVPSEWSITGAWHLNAYLKIDRDDVLIHHYVVNVPNEEWNAPGGNRAALLLRGRRMIGVPISVRAPVVQRLY